MKILPILASLIWLLPLYASAEIYVYVDDQGRKHFTDKPHPEAELYQKTEQLQPMPAPKLPKLYDSPASSKSSSSSAKAPSSQLAKQQAKQKQICAKLLDRIEQLNDKLRRAHSNAEGNRWRDQRRELSTQRYRDCR